MKENKHDVMGMFPDQNLYGHRPDLIFRIMRSFVVFTDYTGAYVFGAV